MTEAGSLSNYWCDQCGTRVIPDGTHFVPSLVLSCRAFGDVAMASASCSLTRDNLGEMWKQLGIVKAIGGAK